MTARGRGARARIRRLLKPPRRLRFTRAGWVITVGSVVLGFAAIGTGNNLLFLLLGAMLGFIGLSGWISEQTLRGLEAQRLAPVVGTAGATARITYRIGRGGGRLPSFSVEVGEAGLPGRGWIAALHPGEARTVRAEVLWERRGIHPLTTVVLGTGFPFGLFRKERDVEIGGEAIVRPRTDRPVREPRPSGRRAAAAGTARSGAAAARGDFRSLREYRTGDDRRDLHARSSARAGEPIVREYERDRGRALWICLDLRALDERAAEVAAEIAAAVAAGASRRGERFALATGDDRVEPGSGEPQLERVLDALARARFRPDAPAVHPPVARAECVRVRADAPAESGWGDEIRAGDET